MEIQKDTQENTGKHDKPSQQQHWYAWYVSAD